MKKYAPVLLAAVIFGLGLAIGGMLQPARVVGFLDFFGRWDPTLAFVMAGALALNGIAYRLSAARGKPIYDEEFHLPKEQEVTPSLVVGSAVFGVGWALAGYCPGPALTNLGTGSLLGIALVGALIAGNLVASKIIKSEEV